VSYRLDYGPGVEQAIERLAEADPAGAEMVVDAVEALTIAPRPAGVHVLNAAEGLHRLHLDRLDPDTRRCLRYRITYQIDDGDMVVLVVTVGSLPRPSRRP